MRPRRALPADRRERALRPADRRAARPLERGRPGQDRADRARSHRRALRLPPRLPGRRALPGLRLRTVGPPHHRGARAEAVRPRRDRTGLPAAARPAVLVLLRLQRLEQPARGRLGDDPARLRRGNRERCAREATGQGRLQPARGSGAGELGRRQAPPRRRDPSGRVPGGRLARELLRRRAVPRQLRRTGRRLRQHDRSSRRPSPGGRDDPERPGSGSRRVPVDRLPGPLGRAPARVLQRPDRPEPEDAVDAADHVVGGLARPELHRPGRERVRDGGDRLLLPGDRQRLEGAGAARPSTAAVHPGASRCWRCCSCSPSREPRGARPRRFASRAGAPGARRSPRRRACTSRNRD